jgi:hypothetical protein
MTPSAQTAYVKLPEPGTLRLRKLDTLGIRLERAAVDRMLITVLIG